MSPFSYEQLVKNLENEISDLELCLAGNSTSKRWQKIQIELTKAKQTLRTHQERYAKLNPQGGQQPQAPRINIHEQKQREGIENEKPRT